MRELFAFQMPATQPAELGRNNIHAIITIDQNGQIVGELLPHKEKMITPTMPNRGSGVFAMAGSDIVQYFNPKYPKHHSANINLYEDILNKTGVPEALALLSFTQSGVAKELDLSNVKIPKDSDPNKSVRLAFIYAPTGQYLHECPAIINYWINLRRQKQSITVVGQTKCIITGQLGTPLTDAPIDVKFGSANGKLFSCNNDDAISFGSPRYASTGVTTETYTELVQRLNYLGDSPDHQLRLGDQTILIWSDGASTQPLLQGLQSPLSSGEPTAAKKTRKKGSVESINITDTSFEGVKQRLLSLWKGAHAVVKLDARSFYTTIITSQKTKIELTTIRKAGLVEVVNNIALYHAKQLRSSRYSRPHWSFLDAIYPKVTSKNKPYTDRDRVAIFNHAVYGQPLPRALITKALGRLRVEGIPISSTKHQIKVSDRAYTQLSFLSLEIPMTEIADLKPKQRQAYALGKLYSYACRQADLVSKTSNHGVRKLWGQINRNPKRALYQLAKRFPIYVKEGKDQAIFNSLYRSVMEASSEVPDKIDLDYGVAFMWGVAAIAPKSSKD